MTVEQNIENQIKNRGTPVNVASKDNPFVFPYIKGTVDSFLPFYDLQAYRENGYWYIKPTNVVDYEKVKDPYTLVMLDYHHTVISRCLNQINKMSEAEKKERMANSLF